MSKTLIPVIGYIRVSRVGDRGGDSFLSPDLQRAELDRLAQRDGLKLFKVIEELDASGGDSSRPGWNEAIEAVESGKARGIAVWNLSRFSRSVKDALNALERIEAAGGRLYSATETWDDSPSGKFTRNVFLSLSEMERSRALAGFKASQASALERGLFGPGASRRSYAGRGRRFADMDE